MVGEVWIYDILIDKKYKILNEDLLTHGDSVKKVDWITNNSLIVLIGNTFGTISSNHTISVVDIETGVVSTKYKAHDNQDIQNLTIVNDTTVEFSINTYNSDFTEYTSDIVRLDIDI